MHERRWLVWGICAAVAACWVAPAWGNGARDIQTGEFWLGLDGQGEVVPDKSGGSGWANPTTGQQWFWYDNPDYDPANGGPVPLQGWDPTVPGWHNEWWYDHPPDPARRKRVTIEFDYELLDPVDPSGVAQGGLVDVWINWSTLQHPETGPDGPPPMTNDTLDRARVYQFPIPPDPNNPRGHYFGAFELEDWDVLYNPEWISVDVWGTNVLISQPEWQGGAGQVTHECYAVPEPVTMLSLAAGLCAFGGYLRRRRRA